MTPHLPGMDSPVEKALLSTGVPSGAQGSGFHERYHGLDLGGEGQDLTGHRAVSRTRERAFSAGLLDRMMTLVLNEIHFEDRFENSFMIAAADRRITHDDGRFQNSRKVFSLPGIHGAVSFFGLAEVWPEGRREDMSPWLGDFVETHADVPDLKTFSESLRDALHEVIPASSLVLTHSGLQICGYTQEGIPDFWFLTNIGGWKQPFVYYNFSDRYGVPTSHFLGRDAKGYGWNGTDRAEVKAGGGPHIYRNGDFKQHSVSWGAMDLPLLLLEKNEVIRKPDTAEEYARYFKAKFEFMAAMSEDLYLENGEPHPSYIGRPIDVILVTPDKEMTV